MSGSAWVVATIGLGGLVALASYVLGLVRNRARSGRRAPVRPSGNA